MGDKTKKAFHIHDLYPANYHFDYEAFSADPEAYVFTADDIAYLNAMELERYEREVPMSPYEKKLLRKWVMSGHSPSENPGSKYVMDTEPYDFLAMHRINQEIRRDMRGMTQTERIAYLKEEMGWQEESEDNASCEDYYPYGNIPFD